MCACTEPIRTGIGAVCVEYGRPLWPITMLNQTRVQKNVLISYFWHPMLVRRAMRRLFYLKAKNGLGRFALSALPDYNMVFVDLTYDVIINTQFYRKYRSREFYVLYL